MNLAAKALSGTLRIHAPRSFNMYTTISIKDILTAELKPINVRQPDSHLPFIVIAPPPKAYTRCVQPRHAHYFT